MKQAASTAATRSRLAGLSGLFLAVLLSAASVAAQTAAGPAVALTPEQALRFRRMSDLQYSPDGLHLVCVVSEFQGEVLQPHLWLLDTRSGESGPMARSVKSERSPQWSPDGHTLTFLSNRDGRQQIYSTANMGGEVSALTSIGSGVSAYRWSPDGKQIAFLAKKPKTDLEKKQEADRGDAQIADQECDLEHLWIVDVASKQTRELTPGGWKIEELDWASGDRLVVIATHQPFVEAWTEALYSVSVTDGRLTLLSQPKQPFSGLTLSPDGKWLSYVGARDGGPIPHDLFIESTAGGPSRDVTASIDREVTETRWQNDSTVIVRVTDGFQNRLHRVGLEGTTAPIDLPWSNRSFAIAPDGSIAFVGVGFNRLWELFIKTADGATRQVSHLQEELNGVQLADPELFRFKSFDGRSIEAALFEPKAPAPPARLPLVLLVHGGPAASFSAEYTWITIWAQLLVARGYEVLMVNPRGSTGYGEDFVKANRADWGGGDFQDLMAALDIVLARGRTDPKRLGIGGWSYGGEMTALAIGKTDRFQAAVTGGLVFNQSAEFETEDSPAGDEWYFGTPWEHPDVFARNSPATYVSHARTPTLIVHGEADHNNPVGQSLAFYRALKHYGVESQLVIYPREPHSARELKHQVDILNRLLAWFDGHLKAGR